MKLEEKNDSKQLIKEAHYLVGRNKLELALELVYEAMNERQLRPAAEYEYARILFKQKKYEEARQVLENIVNKDYTNKYNAIFELGLLEKINKDYSKAIEYFNKIIESDKEDKSYAMFEKATCYFKQKRYELAEELAMETLEQYPDLYKCKILLVKIKIETYRYKEALKIYESINYDKKETAIHLKMQILKARCISELHSPELAIEIYDRIMKYNAPERKEAIFRKAQLKIREAKYYEASLLVKELLPVDTANIEVLDMIQAIYDNEELLKYQEEKYLQKQEKEKVLSISKNNYRLSQIEKFNRRYNN
ncbi:MAG: CDC27 family protein [Bacilli bacterium]|nr:CDC27 family protein [Bacilli bacterium]